MESEYKYCHDCVKWVKTIDFLLHESSTTHIRIMNQLQILKFQVYNLNQTNKFINELRNK
jgi:hypothetical protein